MGTLAGDFNEDGQIDVLIYYWGRERPLFYLRATEERSQNPAQRSFGA